MPAYKDNKTGTWCIKRRYKDWTGETKYLTKRGFDLKREAIAWEADFMQKQDNGLNMSFANFYQVYKEDVGERLKESTWETKASIIEDKLIPYFGNLKMREIGSVDVIRWQNEMMRKKQPNGKLYSQTYLKTVHNQLSAIFNYAMRHYKLAENPARIAGSIGEKNCNEINIWTKEEYIHFSEAIMDKPRAFYCFEMLYWCGIREGELMALTKEDFDFREKEVSITKTYHRAKGKDIITTPKTKQSIRRVSCSMTAQNPY